MLRVFSLKSYLMQVCKPCFCAFVESVEPFKLHPMSMSYIYKVFGHLLRLWMGIWLTTHIVSCTDAVPDLWKLAEILPDASVQTKVFEQKVVDGHLAHIPIITTTDTSQDLGKLSEILPFVSVQTMPLYFGWGCRTFQTTSHAHGISIWGVWASSQIVHGHMASHSHRYHHRCFPRFGKLAEILPFASVQTMPLRFDRGCRTIQTASHVHVINI